MTLREKDADLSLIKNKLVAVIGYGSQGSAQAKNLRDSGIELVVGLREGTSFQRATENGFFVLSIEEAVKRAEIVVLLTPESSHKEIIEGQINNHCKPGAALIFAHGYTVRFGVAEVRSDIRKILVAPKAIGPQLRLLFENGKGAPALVAASPEDLPLAVAYASAIGCGKSAIVRSSFEEETDTDLFGEQAVLCGGIPALAMAAFETLVKKGYSKEAAYFECLYEIKLIADLMVEYGMSGMFERISDTALFGAMTAGKRIINKDTRAELEMILSEIQSGQFAIRFATEQENNFSEVEKWREEIQSHEINNVKFD